jgi:hypothetical protein
LPQAVLHWKVWHFAWLSYALCIRADHRVGRNAYLPYCGPPWRTMPWRPRLGQSSSDAEGYGERPATRNKDKKEPCLGLSLTGKTHHKQSTPKKGSSMLQCRKATRALPVLHQEPQYEVAQVKTPQKQIPNRELSGMIQRAKMLCWPPPRAVLLSEGATVDSG